MTTPGTPTNPEPTCPNPNCVDGVDDTLRCKGPNCDGGHACSTCHGTGRAAGGSPVPATPPAARAEDDYPDLARLARLAQIDPHAHAGFRQATPALAEIDRLRGRVAVRDTMPAEPIEDLIERSSLGTPGVKALRARTPQHVVDEILRRVQATEAAWDTVPVDAEFGDDPVAAIEAIKAKCDDSYIAGCLAGWLDRFEARWAARDTLTPDQARLALVHELHEAIYGASWARPESPAEVWKHLLDLVRSGRCTACIRGDSAAAARDALIQAACDLVDWQSAAVIATLDEWQDRNKRFDDLRAAVGVYRTNQTPEGNPT